MEGDNRQTLDTKKVMDPSQTAAPPISERISGADRFQTARRILIVLLLLTASCLAIIAVDGTFRKNEPRPINMTLFRELGLQYPAVIPSGRLLRHPEFVRDGVDLRFSPAIPRIGTDPALLVSPINGDRPGP